MAEQESDIARWAEAVDRNGYGTSYEQVRDMRTAMIDNLGALLRVREGVCLPRWERQFGVALPPLLQKDPALRSLLRTGVLQLQPCPIKDCSCVTGGDSASGLTCSAGIDDDAVEVARRTTGGGAAATHAPSPAATAAASALTSPPEAFPGAASAPPTVHRLVTTSRSLALADGILQCFAQAMRADGLVEATGAPREPGAAARTL